MGHYGLPSRSSEHYLSDDSTCPSSLTLRRGSLRSSLCSERRLETMGIEPTFLRCDRSVLPLHHVPGISKSNKKIATENTEATER